MRIGWQEIIALTIVLVVVAFAIWRRWRRGRVRNSSCSGSDNASATAADEKPLRMYRRQD